MSALDRDIREYLESTITQLFENPERWEALAKDQLKCLDIEPTLDSALALFARARARGGVNCQQSLIY